MILHQALSSLGIHSMLASPLMQNSSMDSSMLASPIGLSKRASLVNPSTSISPLYSSMPISPLYPTTPISPLYSSTPIPPTDDFWSTWPWRRLTEWSGTCSTEFSGSTIPSLLLEYEQQIADPVNDLKVSDDWCQRALGVLASSYLRVLREERRSGERL